MGTFTVATGFGMLALGLIVIAVMATVGLIVVNSQQKKKQDKHKSCKRKKKKKKKKKKKQLQHLPSPRKNIVSIVSTAEDHTPNKPNTCFEDAACVADVMPFSAVRCVKN